MGMLVLKCCRTLTLLLCSVFAASGSALAHVALDDPNGGEVLLSGAEHTIVWYVAIGHDTVNWDLWYSTTGVLGPWIPIEMNIPPGDISTGALHTYLWTVPELVSDEVRVRVRQDNVGSDYEDISDDDVVIRDGLFFDGFESGDISAWSVTAQ